MLVRSVTFCKQRRTGMNYECIGEPRSNPAALAGRNVNRHRDAIRRECDRRRIDGQRKCVHAIDVEQSGCFGLGIRYGSSWDHDSSCRLIRRVVSRIPYKADAGKLKPRKQNHQKDGHDEGKLDQRHASAVASFRRLMLPSGSFHRDVLSGIAGSARLHCFVTISAY